MGCLKNWDDLRFLISVNRTGSMSAAARELGTNPATVSRRFTRLAEELGYDPFVRTPSGWSFDPRLDELIRMIEGFQSSLAGFSNRQADASEMARDLTIGCAPFLHLFGLNQTLAAFQEQNRHVNLTLRESILYQNRLGDCDLIVSSRRPEQGRLISKRVGATKFGVFGYDEAETNWVALNPANAENTSLPELSRFFPNGPCVFTDTMVGAFHVMTQNRYSGVLPHLIARQDSELRQFGNGEFETSQELYVIYHDTRRNDPLIRAGVDWISETIEKSALL